MPSGLRHENRPSQLVNDLTSIETRPLDLLFRIFDHFPLTEDTYLHFYVKWYPIVVGLCSGIIQRTAVEPRSTWTENCPINIDPPCFNRDLSKAGHFRVNLIDAKEYLLPDPSPCIHRTRQFIHRSVVGGTSSQKENEDEAKKSFHVYDTIPF